MKVRLIESNRNSVGDDDDYDDEDAFRRPVNQAKLICLQKCCQKIGETLSQLVCEQPNLNKLSRIRRER